MHDGDTVVFLGDSITAARTYGKIVENYTRLRFPDRKVRFINAGWGGDTAAGGLKRIDRDVFERGATVLIVAYGVNDIGWGLKADAEHKQIYLDAIRGIVEQMQGPEGAGLHRLGGDHRRASRQCRARLPPDDVRRGEWRWPVRWASIPSTSSARCGESSATSLRPMPRHRLRTGQRFTPPTAST